MSASLPMATMRPPCTARAWAVGWVFSMVTSLPCRSTRSAGFGASAMAEAATRDNDKTAKRSGFSIVKPPESSVGPLHHVGAAGFVLPHAFLGIGQGHGYRDEASTDRDVAERGPAQRSQEWQRPAGIGAHRDPQEHRARRGAPEAQR